MATTTAPRFTPAQSAEIATIARHLDMISRRRGNGWSWDQVAAEYGDDVARIARMCIC